MGKKAKQSPLPKQQPKQQPKSDKDTEHVEAIDLDIPKPRLERSKYWCGHCNFSARTPSSYRNHLYSTRHYRNYQAGSNAKAHPSALVDLDIIDIPTEQSSCSIESSPSKPCIGVPSNEIIHLLESDTESDGERVSDTELNTETASENESNTESEYEYETGSETETESETDTNDSDDEFDRDLPWFGTGMFAHHHRTGFARSSKSTQPQEFTNTSIFIASAFIGGMLLERFMAQYVHGMCMC